MPETPLMMTSPIQMVITDSLTEDAKAGLELYGRLTLGQCPPDLIEDWLYWYRDNPFGEGLFAVAKSRDDVVGVYSLIPVQMQINGRKAKGAKAEFLAVEPDFRLAVEPTSGKALPFAMVTGLNSQAHTWGFEWIFGVSTKASSACMLASGSGRIRYQCDEYRTYFAPPKLKRYGRPIVNRCAGYYQYAQTTVQRCLARLFASAASKSAFKQVDAAEAWNNTATTGNQLISSSPEMLSYRFPAERHLFYRVRDESGKPALLVFAKPGARGNFALSHWSTTNIAMDVWAAVLRDVMGHCTATGAHTLQLCVPTTDSRPLQPLRKLGFTHRTSNRTIYYYRCRNISYRVSSRSWRLTESHIGFY